ncbi:MAG TPA: sulfurtransferase TusA family protein [Methylococcus sp.]|nr:sulfurtransferase TusA family protein [Methylococcus sp.]
MSFDHELDTSGLMCPLPLLRLKKTLQVMSAGQVVRVRATDPASVLDFGVYLEQAGHELLQHAEESGVLVFLIRKG